MGLKRDFFPLQSSLMGLILKFHHRLTKLLISREHQRKLNRQEEKVALGTGNHLDSSIQVFKPAKSWFETTRKVVRTLILTSAETWSGSRTPKVTRFCKTKSLGSESPQQWFLTLVSPLPTLNQAKRLRKTLSTCNLCPLTTFQRRL